MEDAKRDPFDLQRDATAHGRTTQARHSLSLALMLTYVLLAKAVGATSLQAISEWIRLRADWLQEMLSGVGTSFPCAATYSKVLRAVDPEQVNTVLMSLLTRIQASQREAGQQQHTAVDGKTLRGTQHHLAADQKKVHQVSMYEVHTGVVLKEQVVQEREGEQSRMHELLIPQWVSGPSMLIRFSLFVFFFSLC